MGVTGVQGGAGKTPPLPTQVTITGEVGYPPLKLSPPYTSCLRRSLGHEWVEIWGEDTQGPELGSKCLGVFTSKKKTHKNVCVLMPQKCQINARMRASICQNFPLRNTSWVPTRVLEKITFGSKKNTVVWNLPDPALNGNNGNP